MGIAAKELMREPRGHVKLRVYRGDVERLALTDWQREENRLWMEEGILIRHGEPVELGEPGKGLCLLPVHVGRITDFPIDEIDLWNLVVTNGKGLLLDRLYAMGGPPSQITHMGIGNSATAAAVGDTQLLGSSPVPDLRAFDALPTRAGLVVTQKRTYATGEGNQNWQEIATFNGSVNGTSTMFNRIAPIGPFNKTSAVSIEATTTTTQS